MILKHIFKMQRKKVGKIERKREKKVSEHTGTRAFTFVMEVCHIIPSICAPKQGLRAYLLKYAIAFTHHGAFRHHRLASLQTAWLINLLICVLDQVV